MGDVFNIRFKFDHNFQVILHRGELFDTYSIYKGDVWVDHAKFKDRVPLTLVQAKDSLERYLNKKGHNPDIDEILSSGRFY